MYGASYRIIDCGLAAAFTYSRKIRQIRDTFIYPDNMCILPYPIINLLQTSIEEHYRLTPVAMTNTSQSTSQAEPELPFHPSLSSLNELSSFILQCLPSILVSDQTSNASDFPIIKRTSKESSNKNNRSMLNRVLTSTPTNPLSVASPVQIKHFMPLQALKVTLNGIHNELALLDDGSKIVVIREDVWRKTQNGINMNIKMQMQTANEST